MLYTSSGMIRTCGLAVAFAAALALAGCGGGGSPQSPAATGPTLEERQGTQRAAIADAISAARTAVLAVDNDSSEEDVTAAEMAVADATAAINAAEDVSDAEKAGHEGTVTSLSTILNRAKATRLAAINDANEKSRIAAQKTKNDASMQVAEAINAHAVAHNPPPEFVHPGTLPANSGDTNFGVSRGSGNAKFTLTQTTRDKKMKPFTTGTAQDAGTGWSGMTFTRSGTSGKRPYMEKATVYTDIETASDLLWTALAPTGLTVDETGVAMWSAGTSTTNNLDAEHFTGAILPAPPAADNTGGTKDLKAAGNGVAGTLYGVSGRFTASADVVVTRTAKEKVYVTGGTVTFTPDSFDAATTMAKYAKPDADYTHFGYWMKSTKQRDGSYNHDIETFHRGNALGTGTGLATVSDLEGSAKYYGAAAGVYVKKDGAGDSLVVTNGNFTADAMLSANFGGDLIAKNDQFKVSGTISDFMDGSTDLGFADLTLEKSSDDFSVVADTVTAIGSLAGETNGGGRSGNWSGQFYGQPDGVTDAAKQYPLNVSGEFNGHFTNGHVAGAFGAEKD